MGNTTAKAILGDKIASSLLDHYLAETGVDGQSGSEPVNEDRPDNLFTAPPGDPGAHGRFDGQAVESSWQMALNRNRNRLFGATGLAAAAGLILARWRSRS